MREFSELQVLSDHTCSARRAERIEVYEPICAEFLWLTIFGCCSQVFSEPSTRIETLPVLRALAASGEAA